MSLRSMPEGWSVTYNNQPTAVPPALGFDPVGNPKYVVTKRAGYDTAGNFSSTRYTDNLLLTASTRQAYPSQASQHATGRCAVNSYIYADDTVHGELRTTLLRSQSCSSRQLGFMPRVPLIVGTTVFLEAYASPPQCPEQQASRLGHFLGHGWSQSTVSTDGFRSTPFRHPVMTSPPLKSSPHSCTLDISTLTNNHLITCNFKAYPWIGVSGSVLDTSSGTELRGASPYYVFKNTSRAATPPVACVSTGGNDTTGRWATSYAAAALLPFATIAAASNGIMAAANTAVTGSDASGLHHLYWHQRRRVIQLLSYLPARFWLHHAIIRRPLSSLVTRTNCAIVASCRSRPMIAVLGSPMG